MLAIPAKRADVVDLGKTLKAFFAKKFPADSAHFQNDITSFQQLRSAAVAVTDAMDRVGQQQLLRYHYHVSVMVLRLNDFEKEMKLSFSWYDAYRPSRRFTSSDIYFDMAGVLWNMAAFESTRSARADRSTDEGVRQASRGFQQAAGILDILHKNIVSRISSGLSPDLTNESLEMAKALMLAQAQACFYEKAVRDRRAGGAMKPAVLSKLAFEAAALFSSALSFAKFGTLATALDDSWPCTLRYQIESFTSAAEYWQSMVAKETALQNATGYGVEISRLTRAERHATQAIAICQEHKFLTTLAHSATELLNAIRKLKTEAETDNARIYLEVVPNPDSLPALTGARMVKCLEFPEYYNNEKPLFKDFTSSDIRAMVEQFRNQVEGLYRQQEEAVAAAGNHARSALSAQGLPGSLEMYKSGGKLPENLWQKIEQIQQLGGVREVQRKLAEVMASAASADATLEAISATMQRENRADDAFRAKFPQYTASIVPYSDKLFEGEIKEPLASLRQASSVAGEANSATRSEMHSEKFAAQARVLSMSRAELSEYLNSNGNGSGSNFLESVSVGTSGLEAALVALASLMEARDESLKSLRAAIDETLRNSDDLFLQRRTANAAESKDSAVEYFISQLYPKVDQIRSQIDQQVGMLAQISSLNNTFVQQRQTDSSSMARDANMKNMEEAVAKFFELHGKLSSGESFYTNLQMRLSKLNRSSEDIAFSQQLQRQEFEQNVVKEQERLLQERKDQDMAQQLSADFSRLSANPTPNQPPPAPTPFSSSQPQAPPGVTYGQPVYAPPGHSAPPSQQAPPYNAAAQYPTSAGGQYGYPSQHPPTAPYGSGSGAPSGVPVYQGDSFHRGTPQNQPPAQQQQPSYAAQQGYQQPATQAYGASPYATQPFNSAPASAPAPAQPVSYSYGTAPYSSSSTPAAAPPPQSYPTLAGGDSGQDKVRRLTDMGFEATAAQQALNMYNGNEEAAVNYLLGGGGGAGSTNLAAQAAPPPAAEPPKKKGWW